MNWSSSLDGGPFETLKACQNLPAHFAACKVYIYAGSHSIWHLMHHNPVEMCSLHDM